MFLPWGSGKSEFQVQRLVTFSGGMKGKGVGKHLSFFLEEPRSKSPFSARMADGEHYRLECVDDC